MNNNEEVRKEWAKLHEELVNKVISFCIKHEIKDADEFSLNADGLKSSIDFGSWHPGTDSAFSLFKRNKQREYENILSSM